jgi:hypothetical protein
MPNAINVNGKIYWGPEMGRERSGVRLSGRLKGWRASAGAE